MQSHIRFGIFILLPTNFRGVQIKRDRSHCIILSHWLLANVPLVLFPHSQHIQMIKSWVGPGNKASVHPHQKQTNRKTGSEITIIIKAWGGTGLGKIKNECSVNSTCYFIMQVLLFQLLFLLLICSQYATGVQCMTDYTAINHVMTCIWHFVCTTSSADDTELNQISMFWCIPVTLSY